MKLLWITEFFPDSNQTIFSGGVEARMYFIHKYLSRHQITVISRPKIQVTATNRSVLTRFNFLITSFIKALRIETDLVEGSNITAYLPAWIVARMHQKPAIAWVADIYGRAWFANFGTLAAFSGYCLEKITLWLPWNQVIAMSQTTKNKLIAAGMEESKITVIYGGVETEKLAKLSVSKYARPTVTTICRLVEYKRVADLIEAVKLLETVFPELRLQIIGDGPEKTKLHVLAKTLGISHKVLFTGSLSHHQAMIRLKKAHLFSLASVVEGFGLVTIEACACGVPYVNSSIAPTIEITNNGQGGVLYQPKNTQELAQAIKTLLENPILYAQKVSQAKKLAVKYDWKLIAQQTEKVYKQHANQSRKL